MYGGYHPEENYYRCKSCKKLYASMSKVNACIEDFFTGAKFLEKGLDALRENLVLLKKKQVEFVPEQRKTLINRKTALESNMNDLED